MNRTGVGQPDPSDTQPMKMVSPEPERSSVQHKVGKVARLRNQKDLEQVLQDKEMLRLMREGIDFSTGEGENVIPVSTYLFTKVKGCLDMIADAMGTGVTNIRAISTEFKKNTPFFTWQAEGENGKQVELIGQVIYRGNGTLKPVEITLHTGGRMVLSVHFTEDPIFEQLEDEGWMLQYLRAVLHQVIVSKGVFQVRQDIDDDLGGILEDGTAASF